MITDSKRPHRRERAWGIAGVGVLYSAIIRTLRTSLVTMATKLELRTFQKTLPPINFNVCRGLTHRGVSTPTLANLVSLFLSHFDV